MRFAESTIREKDSPDRQKARGWDGRFARTGCCSAARWDAQNITKLDQDHDRHPALHVDLMLVDHRQDLLTDGIDVALQFAPLADSSATTRHVRDWPRVLAASPAYLVKAGSPRTPADPSGHTMILGPVSVSTNWSSERAARLRRFALKAVSELQATRGRLRQPSPEWVPS